MSANDRLKAIAAEHPEWQAWLAVLAEVRAEAASGLWDAAVPERPASASSGAPLLDGVQLRLPPEAGIRYYARLARAAGIEPMPRISEAQAQLAIAAALAGDIEAARRALTAVGGEPVDAQTDEGRSELVGALAALLPIPFVEACARQWCDALPRSWPHGYCPVCGGWPAFAELRGVERLRYLRCGRCGCGWQRPVLACAYCGNDDHKTLMSLVAEREGPSTAIDACTRCQGYTKAFTRLTAISADTVMLEDLASAELDVAATTRGYRRPSGVGRAPQVRGK